MIVALSRYCNVGGDVGANPIASVQDEDVVGVFAALQVRLPLDDAVAVRVEVVAVDVTGEDGVVLLGIALGACSFSADESAVELDPVDSAGDGERGVLSGRRVNTGGDPELVAAGRVVDGRLQVGVGVRPRGAVAGASRIAIVALQAKRMGINRVIAIARDPDYVALMEDSGITCISAPYATSAMVENYLDRPGVADLFEIETGVASLIDLTVPDGAEVVGRRIQDIDIPEQCVVAAIIREDEFVVPRGSTEVCGGDHVVFVGPSDAVQTAHAIFSAM